MAGVMCVTVGGFPVDDQQVAVGVFHAFFQPHRRTAAGALKQRDGLFNGGEESRVGAGFDLDVGKFSDHGVFPKICGDTA
jgi:hypothetical protein